MRYLALSLLLLTASCADISPFREECLNLRMWTPEQQGQAAADLDLLPKDSPINLMLMDYSRLRMEIRACQSAQ